MKITITGASDDLIEIGGGIVEEFNAYLRDDEVRYLAVSDGTLLRVLYDRDGIWRITPLLYGKAKYSKIEGIVADDTNDVVTLDGDIKWVALANQWAKA